jgi:hypothetical protein
MLIVGVTTEVIVAVIAFEVAVSGLLHVAAEVITTRTTSAFAKVVEMKVGLFVPTFAPFNFHW